jgi:hypothetical protein
MGLTAMDYSRVCCPKAETILKTCVRVTLHQAMSGGEVRAVAAAMRKVVCHYA